MGIPTLHISPTMSLGLEKEWFLAIIHSIESIQNARSKTQFSQVYWMPQTSISSLLFIGHSTALGPKPIIRQIRFPFLVIFCYLILIFCSPDLGKIPGRLYV